MLHMCTITGTTLGTWQKMNVGLMWGYVGHWKFNWFKYDGSHDLFPSYFVIGCFLSWRLSKVYLETFSCLFFQNGTFAVSIIYKAALIFVFVAPIFDIKNTVTCRTFEARSVTVTISTRHAKFAVWASIVIFGNGSAFGTYEAWIKKAIRKKTLVIVQGYMEGSRRSTHPEEKKTNILWHLN